MTREFELLAASCILSKTKKLCNRLTMFWHCIEQVEIPIIHAIELRGIMDDIKEIQELLNTKPEEENAENPQTPERKVEMGSQAEKEMVQGVKSGED